MRYILTILSLISVAFAQEPAYNQMRNNYQFKGIRVDSLLLVPKFADTTAANGTALDSIAGNIIRVGNTIYYRSTDLKKWMTFGGGSSVDTTSLSNRINAKADTSELNGVIYFTDTLTKIATKSDIETIDTTSLSNRIDAKLSISDTSSMLSPYLNGADTLSLSSRISDKIDSIKKANDTVYFKKNGIWFSSFKDSVGSGNGRWGNDTALVILAKVHNDAGSTLLKGEIVYLSGANGDVASVKRANNKYDSTSATTIGMVKDNIANNDTGWVVTQGQISKINTSAFNSGDIVYLDSIDGKFTKTKQYAPYHLVFIGVVERANAGNGQLYIKPQNGYELNELHDVAISSPVNNQVLVYSDTLQLWKNRSVYSVVDTTKLSARIDEKLSISDTAGMLSTYLRQIDTASLSDRINEKQFELAGYDEANDRLGLKQPSPSASLQINSNKNTATQSDTAGILLANSTAAINNTQSVSPPIVWQGNGWKTTATAASQDVRFRAYALPVQGTTNPTGQWIVESNINNAGYSQLFSLTSGSGASIGPVNYSPGKINISSYNIKTAAPTENVMTLSSTETGPSTFPTQLNFLQKGATVGWTIQSVNQGVGYTPLILNELGGNVLIGTTTNQGARLNVNGTIRGSQFILSALNTAPATATSTGTTGEIRIVNGFIYVCVATNTWQRAALSTW